jgi:hypothetical protein
MSASIEEFDFNVNLLNALLWRHNDAANLQSLLESKNAWYAENQTEFWNNWIANVFNLETANEFGLTVWAQILGVPLSLIVPANTGPQFGFGPPQLLTDRADVNGTWHDKNASGITFVKPFADPNGGTQAVEVNLSTATGSAKAVSMTPIFGGIPAHAQVLTFQAKLISGTQGTLASDVNGVTMGTWPALSTSVWTTVTLSVTNGTAGTPNFNLISPTAPSAVVAIFNPQLLNDTEASNGRLNFDNGNFGASASGVSLNLEQKRILLQLQYYKLISRCTVPEINARLKAILKNYGSVYVLDGNNMQFTTYVFGFQPNSALQFVLENFNVLPRPAAVGIKYIVSTRPAFGFGSFNQNFNNGTFWAEN